MSETLAINGGPPVRSTLLPYARQSINDADKNAVLDVLGSDWLTTGPKVSEFEETFAVFAGTKYAVAVSNGTAALHAAMFALDISKGDEVIVPTMTFAATANAVVFQGGTPVFTDCNPETLLLDPAEVEKRITDKTKAIVTVDYAGQPSYYDELNVIAEKHGITLVSDACHALGALDGGRNIGSLATLNTFSFHPVKPMTTGEGGMITTNDEHLAKAMKSFRNHCLSSDHRERHTTGSWFYEMTNLGYNYRLTDIQCALGLSQLTRVPAWTTRRQEIAQLYNKAFAELEWVTPLSVRDSVTHAYHLYVVLLNLEQLSVSRPEIFTALRAENIGVNVHYIPVHLHPYYQQTFGAKKGNCPVAEHAYNRMISLPMFADMTEQDIADTVTAIKKVCEYYSK